METMRVRSTGAVYFRDYLSTEPEAIRPSGADMQAFNEKAQKFFDATGKRLCDFKSEFRYNIETLRFQAEARMLEYEPID